MQALQNGATLQGGKYIIKKILGQGGFGITYLTEHSLLGTNVAIKEFFMKDFCCREDYSTQISVSTESGREQVARFREKFLKEARNIAKMQHPNIVRISDVFEENGTAYYVMDYCERGSLAELLKLHPEGLGEALALKYIRQVASALEHIHEHRMNHFDVKPANILLNTQDNAVLIDFGLSKQYDSNGSQTSTTPVGISHGYAPIEQYKQGGVKDFSPATDIYSLGATLYKLITGQTPPDAQILIEESLPSFSSSNGIKKAISKAMQIKRADRPQSVSEWMCLLDDTDEPISKAKADESMGIESTSISDIEETTKLVHEEDSPKEKQKKPGNNNKTQAIPQENGSSEAGHSSKRLNIKAEENSKKVKNLQWTSKMIKGYTITMAILLVILIFSYSRGIMFPWANIFWLICFVGGTFAIIKERKEAGKRITISKRQSLCGLVFLLLIAAWIFALSQKSNYDKAFSYMKAGDDTSAIKYYTKAYEDGDMDAAGQLAWYYISGIGIEKDMNKAFMLSKESSDKGSDIGDFVNAYCYYWGFGTTADEVKAYDLFSKAARKGQPDAQEWLTHIGEENEHVWVDMGLSVKWAACNIGASNKYEAGDFYAWGETSTKKDYSRDTYFDKDCNTFYNGTGWTSISPTSKYDVANTKQGGKWRLPTEAEFNELITNCEVEKQENGIILVSKINQSSLFFPTPGIMTGNEISGIETFGGYWSSSLSGDYYGDNYYAQAWLINLENEITDQLFSVMRGNGYCVRPVISSK